jgi:tetratricopeptide (TPR) repeat protein
VDGREYHAWAARIAAGDVGGEGVFYQAPLYPYVLGAVYAVTGPRVTAAFALNAVLDVLALAAIGAVARRLVGGTASVLAIAMGAFYGVFLFNVVQVGKSSLDLLLVALLALALVRAEDARDARTARRRWLAAGIVLGFAALNRGNLLLVAPLLVARAAMRPARAGDAAGGASRPSISKRLASAALCTAGALLPIAPVTLRNAVVGGDLVLTSAHGGFNFYVGNHERADGTSKRLPFIRENPEYEPTDSQLVASREAGRSLRPSEVSAWWTRKGVAWLARNPADAIVLYARKLWLLAAAYEIPDSVDYRFVRRGVPLLALPWVSYGIVLPLAIAGLIIAGGERRSLGPLPFLLISVALSLLPFYIFSRYRLPLVPLLLPPAAYALVSFARVARAARTALATRSALPSSRTLLTAGFIALAAMALVAIPPPWVDRSFAVSHANLGNVLAEQGRIEEAIASYDSALAEAPGYVNARLTRAALYRRTGRAALAESELRAILAADPSEWYARSDLARILLDRTDAASVAEAASALEQARETWPYEPELSFALGVALRRLGRTSEAIAAFREAVALAPAHDDARWNLALMLIETSAERTAGQERAAARAEALEHLRVLRMRRPDDRRIDEALRSLGS